MSDRLSLTSVSLDSYFYLIETGVVAAVACHFVAVSPAQSLTEVVAPLLWVSYTVR